MRRSNKLFHAYPSSLCGVHPLSCVFSEPALLPGAVVTKRHSSGAALNSAGPALLRTLSASRNFTGAIRKLALLFNRH